MVRAQTLRYIRRPKYTVATHCLLEAVVALVTRTRKLKAILLDDGCNEGARVCN